MKFANNYAFFEDEAYQDFLDAEASEFVTADEKAFEFVTYDEGGLSDDEDFFAFEATYGYIVN